MISITIGKSEKRSYKQHESDGYDVSVTMDVEDPNKLEERIAQTFALIRSQIQA